MQNSPPEADETIPPQRFREVLMERLDWNEADLQEQMDEAQDQALAEIVEEDGTPVDTSALTPEEIEEAVLMFLYQQHIVVLLGEDPLGIGE